MTYEDKTIYQCCHCGERGIGKKKFCSTCGTKAGRDEVDRQNLAIAEENKLKGLWK